MRIKGFYMLKENLEVLKNEMLSLFKEKQLAKDAKFLRKMAINIKHLHYSVNQALAQAKCPVQAKKIEHFLSTPLRGPITLSQAADTFSEQHPKESDLSYLLESAALKRRFFSAASRSSSSSHKTQIALYPSASAKRKRR